MHGVCMFSLRRRGFSPGTLASSHKFYHPELLPLAFLWSKQTEKRISVYPLRANQKHHYTLKISTRLGRTRYKEQFMFLYRDDLVDLVGSYQFDDEKTEGLDVFARDLYILGFRCLNTVLKDLVIIPVHTKPEDSDKELDKLYDVFVHVRKKWRTDFFIFIFTGIFLKSLFCLRWFWRWVASTFFRYFRENGRLEMGL
uniref:Uncharacterized protein n=1 Tax=Cyprinodon variegatus TaxID=28743 RepID=A0A3Q2DSK8_CYPVA